MPKYYPISIHVVKYHSKTTQFKVKRPLTPPEVKIAKTVKDELREDMVARQVEMMKKLHYLYLFIYIDVF